MRRLIAAGRRVICAGLDLDFRGEPFGPVPQLLALAERVDKLAAICVVCGEAATRTQRIVNGVPAFYEDPVILVGAAESCGRAAAPVTRCPAAPRCGAIARQPPAASRPALPAQLGPGS